MPPDYTQPAQQTALGKEGHGLLPRYWVPNRGLVKRSSLPMLPEDACTVAKNVRWNGLTWTTQKIGWSEVRASVFGNGAILEQAVHWNSAGEEIYIHQAGSLVQKYDPVLGGSETTLFTASSTTALPCMRSFSPNYFLYVNGVDVPKKWDGTTWASIPAFPVISGGSIYATPKLVETFNNRPVYSAFPNNPYAVIIGNFNNPDAITIPKVLATDGGIYFVPSQLGPVTTIRAMQLSITSPEQILLIGCKNGFAFISGVDADSFQMVALQSNKWGMPSNRAWFTIDTTTYGLCSDGIRPFNSNLYLSNLVSSSLSFPVHPLITAINKARGEQIFCLDNSDELEVAFYYCTGGDIFNNSALIMGYSEIALELIRFSQKQFPSGGSTYSPACGIKFKDRYFSGGFDGKLQEQYTSNKFNDVGFDYEIGSPLFPAPTPAQEASIRGLCIVTEGDTTRFTVESSAWTPQAAGSQQLKKTVTANLDVEYNTDGTTALGTTFILGSATFGGSQYNISPLNPPGGGKAHQFKLKGNTDNGDLNLIGIFGTLIGGGTRQ